MVCIVPELAMGKGYCTIVKVMQNAKRTHNLDAPEAMV